MEEITNWAEHVSVCLFVAGLLLAHGSWRIHFKAALTQPNVWGLEGEDE